MPQTVTAHVKLLGILQIVWGAIGLLLGRLDADAGRRRRHDRYDLRGPRDSGRRHRRRVRRLRPALLVVGVGNAWAGRRFAAASPPAASPRSVLAVPNLFVLPFGTALGIYALWVLLHDETRRCSKS